MASFFENFTPQEVARISAAGRRLKLPEGWSPIWEYTPADKAYILIEGTVSVRQHGDEIAQVGAGEIFGEAAIVGHSLRNACIVALTPLDVIHFTDDDVRGLIDEMPSFKAALDEVDPVPPGVNEPDRPARPRGGAGRPRDLPPGRGAQPHPRRGGRAGRRTARDRARALATPRLPDPDGRRGRVHAGRRTGAEVHERPDRARDPQRRPAGGARADLGALLRASRPTGRPTCSRRSRSRAAPTRPTR